MAPKGAKKAKLSEDSSVKRDSDYSSGSFSESSSADEKSQQDSASESEEDVFDDEVDVSESGSEAESEPESESEVSRAKQTKRDDGFGTAMDAILNSRVKAHDAADPILIRNKRTAREIDEAKSESKARRALRAEKLQFKDRAHVAEVIPKDPEAAGDSLQHEKLLRRTAQRGVIKLLNAIHSAQVAASTAEGGSTKKQAAAQQDEVSKEKFLDMIRMG